MGHLRRRGCGICQENPERELVFIHRVHISDWGIMDEYFAPMLSVPNIKFDLSHKYSLAHMHGAIKPDFGNFYGNILPFLRNNNLETWLNLRNDDFFFLHWADPTSPGTISITSRMKSPDIILVQMAGPSPGCLPQRIPGMLIRTPLHSRTMVYAEAPGKNRTQP